MTLQTLFGPEEISSKSRTIKFKQIKAVYETLIVREEIADYLKTGNRYTAPSQVNVRWSEQVHNNLKKIFAALRVSFCQGERRWATVAGG